MNLISGILACVFCGSPQQKFRDNVSFREWRISGICQNCQDKVFRKENQQTMKNKSKKLKKCTICKKAIEPKDYVNPGIWVHLECFPDC